MEEIKLFVTQDSLKADMLMEALKGQGIPCYRKDMGAGQLLTIYMGMFTNSGISVYIPESALEQAKEIMDTLGLESEEEDS